MIDGGTWYASDFRPLYQKAADADVHRQYVERVITDISAAESVEDLIDTVLQRLPAIRLDGVKAAMEQWNVLIGGRTKLTRRNQLSDELWSQFMFFLDLLHPAVLEVLAGNRPGYENDIAMALMTCLRYGAADHPIVGHLRRAVELYASEFEPQLLYFLSRHAVGRSQAEDEWFLRMVDHAARQAQLKPDGWQLGHIVRSLGDLRRVDPATIATIAGGNLVAQLESQLEAAILSTPNPLRVLNFRFAYSALPRLVATPTGFDVAAEFRQPARSSIASVGLVSLPVWRSVLNQLQEGGCWKEPFALGGIVAEISLWMPALEAAVLETPDATLGGEFRDSLSDAHETAQSILTRVRADLQRFVIVHESRAARKGVGVSSPAWEFVNGATTFLRRLPEGGTTHIRPPRAFQELLEPIMLHLPEPLMQRRTRRFSWRTLVSRRPSRSFPPSFGTPLARPSRPLEENRQGGEGGGEEVEEVGGEGEDGEEGLSGLEAFFFDDLSASGAKEEEGWGDEAVLREAAPAARGRRRRPQSRQSMRRDKSRRRSEGPQWMEDGTAVRGGVFSVLPRRRGAVETAFRPNDVRTAQIQDFTCLAALLAGSDPWPATEARVALTRIADAITRVIENVARRSGEGWEALTATLLRDLARFTLSSVVPGDLREMELEAAEKEEGGGGGGRGGGEEGAVSMASLLSSARKLAGAPTDSPIRREVGGEEVEEDAAPRRPHLEALSSTMRAIAAWLAEVEQLNRPRQQAMLGEACGLLDRIGKLVGDEEFRKDTEAFRRVVAPHLGSQLVAAATVGAYQRDVAIGHLSALTMGVAAEGSQCTPADGMVVLRACMRHCLRLESTVLWMGEDRLVDWVRDVVADGSNLLPTVSGPLLAMAQRWRRDWIEEEEEWRKGKKGGEGDQTTRFHPPPPPPRFSHSAPSPSSFHPGMLGTATMMTTAPPPVLMNQFVARMFSSWEQREKERVEASLSRDWRPAWLREALRKSLDPKALPPRGTGGWKERRGGGEGWGGRGGEVWGQEGMEDATMHRGSGAGGEEEGGQWTQQEEEERELQREVRAYEQLQDTEDDQDEGQAEEDEGENDEDIARLLEVDEKAEMRAVDELVNRFLPFSLPSQQGGHDPLEDTTLLDPPSARHLADALLAVIGFMEECDVGSQPLLHRVDLDFGGRVVTRLLRDLSRPSPIDEARGTATIPRFYQLPTPTLLVIARALSAYHGAYATWLSNPQASFLPGRRRQYRGPTAHAKSPEWRRRKEEPVASHYRDRISPAGRWERMAGKAGPPRHGKKPNSNILIHWEHLPEPKVLRVHYRALEILIDALAQRLEPVPLDPSERPPEEHEVRSAMGQHEASALSRHRAERATDRSRGRRESRGEEGEGGSARVTVHLPGARPSDWVTVASLVGGARMETKSGGRLMAALAHSLPSIAPHMDGLGLVQVAHAFANFSPSVRPPPSKRPHAAVDTEQAEERWKAMIQRNWKPMKEADAERLYLKRAQSLRPFSAAEGLDRVADEWIRRDLASTAPDQIFAILEPFARAEHQHVELGERVVSWTKHNLLPRIHRAEEPVSPETAELGRLPSVDGDAKAAAESIARIHGLLQSIGVRRLKKRWEEGAKQRK